MEFDLNRFTDGSRTLILEGIVGSHSQGLATTESDVDLAGVFVAPAKSILGLRPPSDSAQTISMNDPDGAYHEVGKMLRLLVKGNPSVMEMLWLKSYEVLTPAGELLVESRSTFLSKAVIRQHLGYINAQVKRMGRGHEPKPKLLRHAFRLAEQCIAVIEHHELLPKLDRTFYLEELPAMEMTEAVELLAARVEGVSELSASSDLPNKPDEGSINDLLLTIRDMVE